MTKKTNEAIPKPQAEANPTAEEREVDIKGAVPESSATLEVKADGWFQVGDMDYKQDKRGRWREKSADVTGIPGSYINKARAKELGLDEIAAGNFVDESLKGGPVNLEEDETIVPNIARGGMPKIDKNRSQAQDVIDSLNIAKAKDRQHEEEIVARGKIEQAGKEAEVVIGEDDSASAEEKEAAIAELEAEDTAEVAVPEAREIEVKQEPKQVGDLKNEFIAITNKMEDMDEEIETLQKGFGGLGRRMFSGKLRDLKKERVAYEQEAWKIAPTNADRIPNLDTASAEIQSGRSMRRRGKYKVSGGPEMSDGNISAPLATGREAMPTTAEGFAREMQNVESEIKELSKGFGRVANRKLLKILKDRREDLTKAGWNFANKTAKRFPGVGNASRAAQDQIERGGRPPSGV
ncbi:hypothetical protein HQ571_06405 [Candidatus Kuenenbacteria bacterium]|nr:hypothetical protein [Candidatus Kuenenbacteria bacterium]